MNRADEWALSVIVVMLLILFVFGGINAKINRTVAEAVKEQCK